MPGIERVATAGRTLRWRRDRWARRRRVRGPGVPPPVDDPRDTLALQSLRDDGYVVLPGAVTADAVRALRDDLERCLADPSALEAVTDDAHGGGLLPHDVVAAGPDSYRYRTNAVTAREPLERSPAALAVALDRRLLSIAAAYLGCPAAIGGVELRRSFANGLPGSGDQFLFHCDPNSLRMLKAIVYLGDVDEPGGPLRYVRGSQRRKFSGWTRRYLWDDAEIEEHLGSERIEVVSGRAGDVVLTDVSGFHTGTKAREGDRDVLFVNYVIHVERNGRHPWLRVPVRALADLTADQRSALDLCRVG
jgi:hypothetical protein